MPDQASPFSPAGMLFLLAIMALSWFRPVASLRWLVMISPFAFLAEIIGWDPRLYWAVILGSRAIWEQLRARDPLLPSAALMAWVGFTAFAAAGLWLLNNEVRTEDLESARSLFFYFLAGSCLFIATARFIRSGDDLRGLLPYFVVSIITVSAIGIFEAFVFYGSGEPVERISGTLDNPNYLSAYLAVVATTLLVFIKGGLLARRLTWLVPLGALICCVLTFSRAGIMAAMIGLALAWKLRPGQRVSYPKLFLTFALLGTLLLFTGGQLLEVRRQLTFSDDPNKSEFAVRSQQAEDLSRSEAFLFALHEIADHSLAGVGLGTFPVRNYDANGVYVTTHNTIMEVLTGTGILGAVLLLWTILALARPLGRFGRRLFLPVFVSFAVCSMFGDYLQSIDIHAVLAIAYVYCRQSVTGASSVLATRALRSN